MKKRVVILGSNGHNHDIIRSIEDLANRNKNVEYYCDRSSYKGNPKTNIVFEFGISTVLLTGYRKGYEINTALADLNTCKEVFGKNMLNYDAIICKFGEAYKHFSDSTKELFIKPFIDHKRFNGEKISQEEIITWIDSVRTQRNVYGVLRENNYLKADVQLDTEVIVSPIYNLSSEYRVFCVKGKIIEFDSYRNKRDNITPSIKQKLRNFAARMAKKVPHECFSMDVCIVVSDKLDLDYGSPLITEKDVIGYKIVEVNPINCAGYFGGNPDKFVKAFIDYLFEYGHTVAELKKERRATIKPYKWTRPKPLPPLSKDELKCPDAGAL